MIRWRSFVLGGLTFTAAHLVQVAAWRPWFQPSGDYSPWFLNSGRAAALVVVCLFASGLLSSAFARWTRQESIVQSGFIAAGAVIAMTVVLLVTGLGSLFPIALAIGAAIAALSSMAGGMTGWALKSVLLRLRS